MTEAQQIATMTDTELTAVSKILQRQVLAPILVGDRDGRRRVLSIVEAEGKARGLRMPVIPKPHYSHSH